MSTSKEFPGDTDASGLGTTPELLLTTTALGMSERLRESGKINLTYLPLLLKVEGKLLLGKMSLKYPQFTTISSKLSAVTTCLRMLEIPVSRPYPRPIKST